MKKFLAYLIGYIIILLFVYAGVATFMKAQAQEPIPDGVTVMIPVPLICMSSTTARQALGMSGWVQEQQAVHAEGQAVYKIYQHRKTEGRKLISILFNDGDECLIGETTDDGFTNVLDTTKLIRGRDG